MERGHSMDLEAKKLMLIEEHNKIAQAVQSLEAEVVSGKEQMLKIRGKLALIEEMVRENEKS